MAALALGLVLRGVDVWRPMDGTIRESWRESDMAAVARNFAREGMDIRYPRIDWRGTGPGFAEMEFPLSSWLTAVGYRVFGVHEEIGRILSFVFNAAGAVVFALIAVELLSTRAA